MQASGTDGSVWKWQDHAAECTGGPGASIPPADPQRQHQDQWSASAEVLARTGLRATGGCLLFPAHCQVPMQVQSFAQQLQDLPVQGLSCDLHCTSPLLRTNGLDLTAHANDA